MASRHQTFLIKCAKGREGIMRLPIDRYGGFTSKAHDMIAQRFYDGTTQERGRLRYALNLEAFTTGESLARAVEDYRNNKI